MRIFPSDCMAVAYTVLLTFGFVNVVSRNHPVLTRATLPIVTQPTVVNCHQMITLLSAVGESVHTVLFGISRAGT